MSAHLAAPLATSALVTLSLKSLFVPLAVSAAVWAVAVWLLGLRSKRSTTPDPNITDTNLADMPCPDGASAPRQSAK